MSPLCLLVSTCHQRGPARVSCNRPPIGIMVMLLASICQLTDSSTFFALNGAAGFSDWLSSTFILQEPCSASKRLPKMQCWTIVQGLHWLLRTIATNYSVLCGRIQEDSPEHQVSLEQEVSKKVQKSRNRTSEARESLARRECSQGGNAKMEEKKPTTLPQNIPSQEEILVASKKKKGKLKLKVKKKSLVQSENTLTEDDSAKAAASGSKVGGVTVRRPSNKVAQENPRVLESAPPPAGQSTKKKNKRLKNKVKSQESSQTQPNEHLSSTFDLYRRAMLALKMQPQGRKPQSTTTP
ncbi:Hypothetical predicted protein [Podarcis lilfordi]|uniref:Uncharacterized protein n=1 Tax=Podarcis lilfordi TaxID=74358 RepID=A0AA35LCW2_9SAUR|nr:Hypothetical predicted protein [Podarcis lilfordi]